jgi:hypothetical protein
MRPTGRTGQGRKKELAQWRPWGLPCPVLRFYFTAENN